MRRLLGVPTKPIQSESTIVNNFITVPGDESPIDPGSSTPYAGHEGEQVVVADDGATIQFVKKDYDLVCFYPGTPPNSQLILQFTFPARVKFAAGLSGSQASVGTAASGSKQDFDLQKNGVSAGTISFAIASTTGTFTFASDQIFEIGDILKIVGPASVDGDISDLSFTLNGQKKVTGN